MSDLSWETTKEGKEEEVRKARAKILNAKMDFNRLTRTLRFHITNNNSLQYSVCLMRCTNITRCFLVLFIFRDNY